MLLAVSVLLGAYLVPKTAILTSLAVATIASWKYLFIIFG